MEGWIKQEDKEPTEKDMPFVTFGVKLSHFPKSDAFNEFWQFWDDSDWFMELTEEERLEWVYWMPLKKPKKDG